MLTRSLILIIALTIFSMICGMWVAQASAATPELETVETCNITQSREFTKPTEIYCDGDLVISDSVELSAPGMVQIVSEGNLHMGKGDKALRVRSNKGAVLVYARTAIGELEVEAGSRVELKYTSVYQYEQRINSASVKAVINGQPLKLEGPQHKIPRDI